MLQISKTALQISKAVLLRAMLQVGQAVLLLGKAALLVLLVLVGVSIVQIVIMYATHDRDEIHVTLPWRQPKPERSVEDAVRYFLQHSGHSASLDSRRRVEIYGLESPTPLMWLIAYGSDVIPGVINAMWEDKLDTGQLMVADVALLSVTTNQNARSIPVLGGMGRSVGKDHFAKVRTAWLVWYAQGMPLTTIEIENEVLSIPDLKDYPHYPDFLHPEWWVWCDCR